MCLEVDLADHHVGPCDVLPCFAREIVVFDSQDCVRVNLSDYHVAPPDFMPLCEGETIEFFFSCCLGEILCLEPPDCFL